MQLINVMNLWALKLAVDVKLFSAFAWVATSLSKTLCFPHSPNEVYKSKNTRNIKTRQILEKNIRRANVLDSL